ncbi:MAG: ABC transporter substrate-binding protein [Gammaproteobacteria bacterium]|nr:MAG: ABC transporter substrate-binding protein [Gammaproteobacteria bacterium]
MVRLTRCLRALVLCLLAAGTPARAATTLKFATLAPPGSTWMNLLEDWAREVDRKSGGRLHIHFYPGGVQGDEPDVLRKIRFGQLQGAVLTGYGIGHIYPPARILELPFLFRDYDEIDQVRHRLLPEFERGFRQHHFELLGWLEVGFVHFFSKKRIDSLDDLKSLRIWLWQGDPLGEAMFRAGGFSPIPLSITEVYTSLQTGLIDTVYCTPLAAIALQWFTQVHYVSRLRMANAIGAIVVSERAFRRLPGDLQALLRETGRAAGERLIQATRRDNEKSLQVLEEEGLEFVLPPETVHTANLERMRDQALDRLMRSGYLPEDLVRRTRALLAEIRAARADNTGGTAHSAR